MSVLSFGVSVPTDLKNKEIKEMPITCMYGLKGFPEVINATLPNTKIQLCIVHIVPNSLKLVPWKDYKVVAADLKCIYQFVTE